MSYLEEYRKYVKGLAEARSSEIICNADKDHATILLTELVKNSEKNLRILCKNMKNMDPDVTGDTYYIDAMAEFLNKENSELKILMTDHYKNENYFNSSEIFSLLKKYKDKVTLKYIKEDELNLVSIDGDLLNFTLSDDAAFRFETDVDKYMALGCFNDRKTVKVLDEKFSASFNLCKNQIPLL